MQLQPDNMAKAGPWHISSGLPCPTDSLLFGYGIIPLPTDQSRSGKIYDHHGAIPPGFDCDIAYTFAF